MPSAQIDLEMPMKVTARYKDLFFRLYLDFFDAWARILTPSEHLVLCSILRFANVETQQSNGVWSIPLCHETTGLDKKTILNGLSTLRHFTILVWTGRNGQTGLVDVHQEVRPPDGANRKDRPWLEKEGRAVPATGTAPVPATGTAPVPATGTAPVPATGTAPVPAAPPTPVPADGTALLETYKSKDRHSEDDDDRTDQKDLSLLIDGYAEMNMCLDTQMASRILREARAARPGVNVQQILWITAAKGPEVFRKKRLEHPYTYLLRCILNCLVGPAFKPFQDRWDAAEARKKEQEKELEEMREYARKHGLEFEG